MTLAIVTPDRIGDCILSLPALVCLQQLRATYGLCDGAVSLLVPQAMAPLMARMDLFEEIRPMTTTAKLRSWLKPPEKAFFLYTSNRQWGFRARESHGWQGPHKAWMRYDVHAPYLKLEHVTQSLPAELITFLTQRYGFSRATIRYFGLCLDLGFRVAQIQEVFAFDPDRYALAFDHPLPVANLEPKGYWVVCMEAAYGSRRCDNRRWPSDRFLELASLLYQRSDCPVVFVGVDCRTLIPDHAGIRDLRGQLSLMALARVLHGAIAFIGNDSGPLHLTNWIRTPSLGIYGATTPENYGPIFTDRFQPVSYPEDIDPVLLALNRLFQKRSIHRHPSPLLFLQP